MDDILRKNIFRDEDLHKLSPDYKPADVMLRMHVRRTMFKDIHNHRVLRISNWHRKSIKRMKDSFKINKEIVKMRNDYRNTNLRNQLIMKSDLKTTRKSQRVAYDEELLLNDINIFNDDTDQCEQDSQEDMAKLVLCNDSDFKLNTKKRAEKPSIDNNINLKNCSNKNNFDANKLYTREKVDEEHSIIIECAFAYKSPDGPTPKVAIDSSPTHENINSEINYKNHESNLVEKGLDLDVNNLQTLLIMMALNKSDNDEDPQNQSCRSISPIHAQAKEFKKKDDGIPLQNYLPNGHIEKSLQIVPIRVEMNERQTDIVKKYLLKWKEHVKKKNKSLTMQRDETLNNFIQKLSNKKLDLMHSPEYKAKLLSQDYNTYQHRYKVQKHIIALQKAKLEEQNRVIEELKYNRIVDASRESVDAMKEQVRRTYFEIDRQLKPKIKCLTNELKLHEIEEPSLVLQCLKVPRFLQRMEKRAREREEKHAMIRERRIQMEEERIRLKQQAELAKAEMDKEEKMKRIKELREKRRKEKVETIRKKQYAARLRALIVMADLHYEKTLTAKYGIRPFRILMQIKRDNMVKAKLHYDFQLKKNIFLNWMWYTEDMWFERHYLAEDFYRKKLLRRYFNGFKQNVRSYIIKKQVADDYYDLYVTQLVFRKFREAFEMIRKENEAKWQTAVIYYNSNLIFKIFTCWRTLPALNALKREQEARKARWRQKVLLVVPDYMPPED